MWVEIKTHNLYNFINFFQVDGKKDPLKKFRAAARVMRVLRR